MKIYLVRHGETDWNQAGLLQGQTDIALNAQGLEQAREAAERLKEVPFEIAFCSPLIRAKRTAETIIGDRKITLTTDERLRELNFGPWEGVDIRSIKDAAASDLQICYDQNSPSVILSDDAFQYANSLLLNLNFYLVYNPKPHNLILHILPPFYLNSQLYLYYSSHPYINNLLKYRFLSSIFPSTTAKYCFFITFSLI